MTDKRRAEIDEEMDARLYVDTAEDIREEINALKTELATEKLVAQKAREHIGNLLSLLDQVGLSAWRTPSRKSRCS
jgi:predicted Zn-dependent peptidase